MKMRNNILGLAISILSAIGLMAQTNMLPLGIDKIHVPEIAFHEAALSDVIDFMARASTPCGASSLPLSQEVTTSNVTYTIIWSGKRPDVAQAQLMSLGPAITMKEKDISLLELFRKIATVAGGTIEFGPDRIRIQVKKVQPPVTHVQKESAADPF